MLQVPILVLRFGGEVGPHVPLRGGFHLVLGRLILAVVAATNETMVREAEHHPLDDVLAGEHLLAVLHRELRGRIVLGGRAQSDYVGVVRLSLDKEHGLAIDASEHLHARPRRVRARAVGVAGTGQLLDLHRPSHEGSGDRVEHAEALLPEVGAEAADDEHLSVSVARLVPIVGGVNGHVSGRAPSQVLAHDDHGHLGTEPLELLGLAAAEVDVLLRQSEDVLEVAHVQRVPEHELERVVALRLRHRSDEGLELAGTTVDHECLLRIHFCLLCSASHFW